MHSVRPRAYLDSRGIISQLGCLVDFGCCIVLKHLSIPAGRGIKRGRRITMSGNPAYFSLPRAMMAMAMTMTMMMILLMSVSGPGSKKPSTKGEVL